MFAGFPTQTEMEEPLLKAIIALSGGSGGICVETQGDELESDLADRFRLTQAQRELEDPTNHAKGHRYWRNHVQMVRRKLVAKGDLAKSSRGYWRVTEAGYRRCNIPHPLPSTRP